MAEHVLSADEHGYVNVVTPDGHRHVWSAGTFRDLTADAPVDPCHHLKSLDYQGVYWATVYVNGMPSYRIHCDNLDRLKNVLRYLVDALLLVPTGIFVQIKLLNKIRETYINFRDVDLPDQVNGWLGNCELKVKCGHEDL